jgi:outer membrane protein assembly factor BamB
MHRKAASPLCISTLIAAAVLVSGAWGQDKPGAASMFRYDVEHTGLSPSPCQLPLVLNWQYATGKHKPGISTPALDANCVYFALDTTLYCCARTTGELKWKAELGGAAAASPVVADDVVYLGCDDGKLRAIGAKDGSALWVYPTGGPIKSSPLLRDGILYFGSDDKRVYAFDIAQKSLLWQYETRGEVRATPAFYHDLIYIGSMDGYLYALRRQDGTAAWRTFLRSRNVFSSPVIERGKVIIAASKYLLARDALSGDRRWEFEAADLITGTPCVIDRHLIVTSRDGGVYNIDANSGAARWMYPKEGGGKPILSSPSAAGDIIFAATGNAMVAGLALKDRAVRWQYKLPPVVEAAPGAAPGGPGTPGMPGGMPGMPGMPGGMPGMPGGMPGMPGGMPGMPGGMPGMPGGPGGGPGMAPPGMPGGMPGMPGGPGGPGGGPGAPGGTGRRGGGRGGPGGQPGTNVPEEETIYKFDDVVRTSPVLAENALYLLGQDGVMYAFNSDAADNIGPVVDQGLLEITGKNRYRATYGLYAEKDAPFPTRWASDVKVPGSPPVYISFSVMDAGSGVDPASVKIAMDGKPVEATFYPADALVWYMYEPRGAAAIALPNGVHVMTVEAADWRGNRTAVSTAFTIDNTMPPPEAPGAAQQGMPGGMPGMPGGMPGMPGGMPGMPGGMPGMPGGMPGMPGGMPGMPG